jgi:hypothetical protein
LAWSWRWRRPASSRRVPGRGVGQRRHRGAPAAEVDLVQHLVMAEVNAARRAPAAIADLAVMVLA